MAFLKKRGDVWYLYWTQDGKKRGRSLGTASKALADQYLKEFEHKLAASQLGRNVGLPLERLRDEYLSYSKAVSKASTFQRHLEPRLRRFVEFLASRGVKKVSEITRAQVQSYQELRQYTLSQAELPPEPLDLLGFHGRGSGLTTKRCIYLFRSCRPERDDFGQVLSSRLRLSPLPRTDRNSHGYGTDSALSTARRPPASSMAMPTAGTSA
jgi:hypothetical protein